MAVLAKKLFLRKHDRRRIRHQNRIPPRIIRSKRQNRRAFLTLGEKLEETKSQLLNAVNAEATPLTTV